MADSEAEKSVVEENSSKTITIFVKTPKEKKEIALDPNATVKKVRLNIYSYMNMFEIRLYSGFILIKKKYLLQRGSVICK